VWKRCEREKGTQKGRGEERRYLMIKTWLEHLSGQKRKHCVRCLRNKKTVRENGIIEKRGRRDSNRRRSKETDGGKRRKTNDGKTNLKEKRNH